MKTEATDKIETVTKNKPSSPKDNIHKNHRQRMRKKFMANPSGIPDHELLEMLLFYSIPRIDTNEFAHLLLNKGSGLNDVLNLDVEAVSAIEGLGESTGIFLKVLKELVTRVEKEKILIPNERKLTKKTITSVLRREFVNFSEEKFILITADKNCRMINSHTISAGTNSTATVPIKSIIKYAMYDNASFVFLAHNHPNGILAASDSDLSATREICNALSYVEIPVIEHFILTEKSEVGIIGKFN